MPIEVQWPPRPKAAAPDAPTQPATLVLKVDGAFVKNTPLVKHRLKAGPHEIEVTNPDFPKKTQKKNIVVHANTDEEAIIISFD